MELVGFQFLKLTIMEKVTRLDFENSFSLGGFVTAEVCVMNKIGVALAADSAVTVEGGVTKIYTSANKLFQLSDTEPIAIMIYSAADFLGVPWETIIKMFREQLGTKTFPLVRDYFDELIDYVKQEKTLFSEDRQTEYVAQLIHSYFHELIEEFEHMLMQKTMSGEIESEEMIETLLSDQINYYTELTKKSRKITPLKGAYKKYSQMIRGIIDAHFSKLPLGESLKKKLLTLTTHLLHSEVLIKKGLYTGVVVAGFGTNEHFPSVASGKITGKLMDKTIYQYDGDRGIDDRTDARVIPYAQREVVSTFMNGVDPDLLTEILTSVGSMMERFTDATANHLSKIEPSLTGRIQKSMSSVRQDLMDKYLNSIKQYIDGYLSGPILENLRILPKDELGLMAESLVNLTKFKRRISVQQETVGGPIDVAVITKGDGFVWLKRKHYFPTELNPRFSRRINKVTE